MRSASSRIEEAKTKTDGQAWYDRAIAAEPVIKFLSVRVDLERKKHEKLRHRREHQAARKQRTAAAAPSAEARLPDGQAQAGA